MQLTESFLSSPIVVSGVGRSGTSILLEAILRHRDVAGLRIAGENPFMSEVAGFVSQYFLTGDVPYKEANNRISKENILRSLRELVCRNSVGDFDWEGRGFWATKAFPTPASDAGYKLLFENVRYVFIIRNPLNVIRSTLRYEGFLRAGFDFDAALNRWVEVCATYEHWENKERALLIRYEDLVMNYRGELTKVMDFCRLSPSGYEEPIEYISSNIINSSFENRKITDLQGVSSDIDPELRMSIVERAGHLLKKYGYIELL